jgi:integrase
VQAKAPEPRYWTPAQLGAFLTWSERDEDELFPAWQLLAATGMRRGEALGLRWGDVDMANGRVAIRRSAVLVKNYGAGESVEIGPPKSGRALVEIDPRTVAVLRRHRAELAALDLRMTRQGAPVLPGRTGEMRHPERFSRSFSDRLARARRLLGDDAPPAIRLHDLRHTHATALLAAGVHAKIVQERLGHATISITLDIYSHVIPTMQRAAADQFAATVYGS